MSRHAARFQPFHRALGNARLRRQLGLREIPFQAHPGQPPAEFAENGVVRGFFGYFHNTSFMANRGQKVNQVVMGDDLLFDRNSPNSVTQAGKAANSASGGETVSVS